MARRGRKRKDGVQRHACGKIVQPKARKVGDVSEATPELMAHRVRLVGGDGRSPDAGWTIGVLFERGLLGDKHDREAAQKRRDAGERLCKVMARYERLLMLPRPPRAAAMAPSDASYDNEDDTREYHLAHRDYERYRAALATRGWQVQAATLRCAKDESGWRVDQVIEGLDAINEEIERKSQKAA